MRDILADRVLAEVMRWMPEDVAKERPDLQALATFKYDEYQQFSPGMRFVESLALWLDQFKSGEEYKRAYDFVRRRLVYISNAEMAHLVSIAFPDHIRPLLIALTAKRLGVAERLVSRISNSVEYKVLLRQSLFLGLSDGAHLDLLRRNNSEINHEQVWQTYEIPDEKAKDMLTKLDVDLEILLNRKPIDAEKRFRLVFLIDDFSGSGISYLRKENDGSNGGKIFKVLRNMGAEGNLRSLVHSEDLHIAIVLYLATTKALSYIDTQVHNLLADHHAACDFTVLPVQKISDSTRLDPSYDSDFVELLKKYFDEDIMTESYRKGKHDEPYLGFDEGALPLILSHNTPNNSVPLLWYEEDKKYRGLFPRVSRHRI